jgi:hypothetical protein
MRDVGCRDEHSAVCDEENVQRLVAVERFQLPEIVQAHTGNQKDV